MTNEEEVNMISENTTLIPSTSETAESSIGKIASLDNIDACAHKSNDSGESERGKDSIKNNAKNGEKKTKVVKLDAKSARRLKQEVQMKMMMHQLAKNFLSARQFWFFTVPQAILTMLSSILAFVATSDLLDNKTKVVINCIVGSTSGVVVFLQTMSGVCGYGTRAAMHDSVAVALRDLRDHLILLSQKLNVIETRKRINNGSPTLEAFFGVNDTKIEVDEGVGENEDNTSNFEDIQTRFKQSLSGCKATVPSEISEAFQGVQSDLNLTGTWKAIECMYGKYQHSHIFEYVHLKAFDILSGEITNSRFFPICLPNSSEVVEVTMNRLKKKVEEAEHYWPV